MTESLCCLSAGLTETKLVFVLIEGETDHLGGRGVGVPGIHGDRGHSDRKHFAGVHRKASKGQRKNRTSRNILNTNDDEKRNGKRIGNHEKTI